jgi:putative transposase
MECILNSESFFRRNLPHWQPEGGTFFVTFRLAGTLPKNVIDGLKMERQRLMSLTKAPEYSEQEWNLRIEKKLFAIWDQCLDRSDSAKWLSEPCVANIVRENLYNHVGERYFLWAYVLMPNHVHILLTPHLSSEMQIDKNSRLKRGALSSILHNLRGNTAYKANRLLGRTGKFWQDEAYDHLVRDNDELQRIISYIENNPIKAGLVKKPEEWKFSSACDRIQKGLEPFDRIA